MLDREDYTDLKEKKAMCPYGRKTAVGGTRCLNCIFNRLGSDSCLGDRDLVRRHMRRLGLDY